VQTTIKFSPRIINPNQPRPIDVLIELTAPPAVALERAPIDAVVVIDRSGSMSGAPLEQVKAAVTTLFRLIGPEDRIAVVTFDSNVEVVLPLAKHDPTSASATKATSRSIFAATRAQPPRPTSGSQPAEPRTSPGNNPKKPVVFHQILVVFRQDVARAVSHTFDIWGREF
jgi:hypothetical protein